MSNTNSVILAAVATAAGLHLIVVFEQGNGTDAHGRKSTRVVIGALFLLLFLYLISEFWPDGARGLALVILLTSLVMNGEKFFYLVRRVATGEVNTAKPIR